MARTRALAVIALGFSWLAADVYLIARDVIVRETRLGVISRFLDKFLPTVIHDLVFGFLAWVVLLGWFGVLVLGFRMLLRPKPSA